MKNHWLKIASEKDFDLNAEITKEIDKEIFEALKENIISDMIKTGDALDIIAIRNAMPDKDRWFDHNYNVLAVENPQVTLNPDTYCPQRTLDIKLKLQYDGQHDGRIWSKSWKEECDTILIEEIMSDIKKQVEAYVAKVNPFSIHC